MVGGRGSGARRGPFVFDRRARYGAALVGTLFAAYLNIAIDFTTYLQNANYQGTITTDVPLVNALQFLTILALYVLAFALAPSAGWRRLLAVTWAVVVLCLWAALGILRARGIAPADDFYSFVLNQGYVTLLVALVGWILVRGRNPIALVAVLVCLVPPFVSTALVDSAVPSGVYTLVTEGVVVVGGLVGAWLAALIDYGVRRMRTSRRAATPATESID